jgi:hypothetical protein
MRSMRCALTAALPANETMIKLSIRVTKDQSAALLALRNGPARLVPALGRAFASGAQDVLGRAVKNRFRGKGPFPVSENRLGVDTNRLWKSLRTTPLQVDAGSGRASLSMGTNVNYFRGHEFGFRGRVQVKSHIRQAVAGISKGKRGAADRKLTRGQISQKKNVILVRGRSSGGVQVRQHTRNVRIPRRRPLGTELASIQTRLTFYQKFNAAIRRILKIN